MTKILGATEFFKIYLKELILRFLTLDYLIFKKIIKREFSYKKGQKILDLGCGTGILAPLFDSKDYTGIDLSPSLISFAQKTYPNYLFKAVDASKFSFGKDLFDKILIAGVIHHMDEETREKTLNLIKKILKKNGVILAIEAIPPLYKFNLLGKFLRDHDEGEHIVSMGEYKKGFEKKFTIDKSYSQKGGIFDYGVFILQNSFAAS